jgi:oligopeptide/dipeptide ABC transporter ATP-binding protein
MKSDKILQVKNLKKFFQVKKAAPVKAVDGVSFDVNEEEVFGLLGELGSGKTTLAYTLVHAYEPTAGEVLYRERNLFSLSNKEISRKMQLILSNPYTSLDPRMTLGATLREVLKVHNITGDREKLILEIVQAVGLEAHHIPRYPHEFSGGQRQRIAIARALVLRPELLIADDPVIALDTSVQATILNLFKDLKQKFGLSCLFISNSLGVMRFISDRVAVMFAGEFVEIAPTEELFRQPLHPYTKHMFAVSLTTDPDFRPKFLLNYTDSLLTRAAHGEANCCKLTERCPYVESRCRKERPALTEVGHQRFVACHLCA